MNAGINLSIHNVEKIAISRKQDSGGSSSTWVYVDLHQQGGEVFKLICFEYAQPIELPDQSMRQSLQEALGLIRKAQERLCAHLVPDSSGDDRECLNDLLAMFDGPEQREIEKKAQAALMPF